MTTYGDGLSNNINSIASGNLKAKNWVAVVANELITQENLVGIDVIGDGTLVLIGSDGTSELDLGSVTADTFAKNFYCPLKVKTGSTATVIALYGV